MISFCWIRHGIAVRSWRTFLAPTWLAYSGF